MSLDSSIEDSNAESEEYDLESSSEEFEEFGINDFGDNDSALQESIEKIEPFELCCKEMEKHYNPKQMVKTHDNDHSIQLLLLLNKNLSETSIASFTLSDADTQPSSTDSSPANNQ